MKANWITGQICLKELVDLFRACQVNGVSKIKVGIVEAEFNSVAIPDSQVENKINIEEEKEDLENMILEDPAKYEEMLNQGLLEDAEAQH